MVNMLSMKIAKHFIEGLSFAKGDTAVYTNITDSEITVVAALHGRPIVKRVSKRLTKVSVGVGKMYFSNGYRPTKTTVIRMNSIIDSYVPLDFKAKLISGDIYFVSTSKLLSAKEQKQCQFLLTDEWHSLDDIEIYFSRFTD